MCRKFWLPTCYWIQWPSSPTMHFSLYLQISQAHIIDQKDKQNMDSVCLTEDWTIEKLSWYSIQWLIQTHFQIYNTIVLQFQLTFWYFYYNILTYSFLWPVIFSKDICMPHRSDFIYLTLVSKGSRHPSQLFNLVILTFQVVYDPVFIQPFRGWW